MHTGIIEQKKENIIKICRSITEIAFEAGFENLSFF